jgi:hypothetical protein
MAAALTAIPAISRKSGIGTGQPARIAVKRLSTEYFKGGIKMTLEVRKEAPVFKPVTRAQAAYLLKTVWPEAPDADIIKAAIICAQYDLNPLMKHLALIKYSTKKGDIWVPVLEIKATRIIAQRKHNYSYLDGPRIMTKAEQETTFGEVDPVNIWAVTIIEENGKRYPGYGAWAKNESPYGSDKGNSKWNMAFIRSERNAIDKMAPGELPRDMEVADETYLPAVNIPAEITEGKKEFLNNTEKEVDALWPEPSPANAGAKIKPYEPVMSGIYYQTRKPTTNLRCC